MAKAAVDPVNFKSEATAYRLIWFVMHGLYAWTVYTWAVHPCLMPTWWLWAMFAYACLETLGALLKFIIIFRKS